jgi:microcystin-dependent protein
LEQQLTDAFLGEIRIFAGDFAPTGWAFCDGQLLPVSQYLALFTVIGTRYGGDGLSTFALPDLRDRVPIGPGEAPGLTPRQLGQSTGTATVTLQEGHLPSHVHALLGAIDLNDLAQPADAASGMGVQPLYRSDSDTTMHPETLASAGDGQPHNNLQPCLAVSFIIALAGRPPYAPSDARRQSSQGGGR